MISKRTFFLLGPLFTVSILSLAMHFPAEAFGGWGFYLDLLKHLRPHLVWATIGFSFLALLSGRHKNVTLVSLISLCLLSWPFFFIRHAALSSSEHDRPNTLSIMHLNASQSSDLTATLSKIIREYSPDIISIQELTPEALGDIPEYSWCLSHARPDTQGAGILIHRGCRLAIQESMITFDDRFGVRPTLTLKLQSKDLELTLINFSSIRPRNFHSAKVQKEQLHSLMKRVSNFPNVVVLGDFNSTPWSEEMRHVCNEESGLSWVTSKGTWPSNLPKSLRIPIDMVLLKSQKASLSASSSLIHLETGDHLGILSILHF
jgi:endonuclease/exonuclease/phosphatase (EEP) superfamily protein YafD